MSRLAPICSPSPYSFFYITFAAPTTRGPPLLAIPFVSAAERKRCGTRDAPRTYPNLTDCRIGLARLFFGRECGLCSRRFQRGFRTRRGSSRVSSRVKRGQGKGIEAGCSRINKGSPESDRWKDKQTERNERVCGEQSEIESRHLLSRHNPSSFPPPPGTDILNQLNGFVQELEQLIPLPKPSLSRSWGKCRFAMDLFTEITVASQRVRDNRDCAEMRKRGWT